jgi:isopentenyldiphosphate isomerase
LDIYDETGKRIGVENRKTVHEKGLWHRTVHCWIVKDGKSLIFQRRSSTLLDNPRKFYTTASGHLSAGESLEDAFARELSEEIGAEIKNPVKIMEGKYSADFRKTDGTDYHDRALYTVFFARDDRPLDAYRPQLEELDGLVEVGMRDALQLFDDRVASIPATGYLLDGGKMEIKKLAVAKDDFVCNPHETLKEKFGSVIEKILEKI